MKKIIISDSSTLVLLEKISLLKLLVEDAKIIIPKKVFDETITNGISKNAADAYRLKEFVDSQKIIVKNIKNKSNVQRIASEFNLGAGETEAIVLFLEEKADLLACDDHKAINLCKIYEIPFTTALAIVLKSFKEKKIDISNAKEMIDKLAIYGRYKREIIIMALNHMED